MATPSNEHDTAEFARLPACESYRLLDFEKAEIRPAFLPNTFVLIVSGQKPYLNMDVELSPRIYIRQPEYWEIEVVGHLPGGFGITAIGEYTVSLPLDSVVGTEGIEVIGAEKTERFRVPPRDDASGADEDEPIAL